MAATNKSELLDITRKKFNKLMKLVVSIKENTALKKDNEDTSIKDIIAHRAHWIDLYLGWYADGQAGKIVYFPAKGYKWNDLKRYNSDLRTQQSQMGWSGALEALQSSFNSLMNFIENCSDEELYGGPMKGANNQWTPGRWAEAAGPSHFRSASKTLRAMLKKDKMTHA